MEPLTSRLKRVLSSRRGGFAVFVTAFAATLIASGWTTRWSSFGILPPVSPAVALTTSVPPILDPRGVSLSGTLSHTKLVQGEPGNLYLRLELTAPARDRHDFVRRPNDIVVVLDRSGSMTEERKLPYAKQAIRDLLARLGAEDRFALVTFDDHAMVPVPLTAVSDGARERIGAIVSQIEPGGSTNMGMGLKLASELLTQPGETRNRRVILLSDGHANVGITSTEGLAGLAKSIVDYGAVVSTIGMGLGFNEVLMAQLADHGMGNYAYLENLATLAQIFANDLNDARLVFAERSELTLHLADGVGLIDAGGYPIERTPGSNMVRIPIGQMISGREKVVTVTLTPGTAAIGEFNLGAVALHYRADGAEHTISLPSTQLAYAVIESTRRDEAVASIRGEIFRSAWVANNLGLMQKAFRQAVVSGDKRQAEQALADYEAKLTEAEKSSGVQLTNDDLKRKLDGMEHELDVAFTGAQDEQRRKQNSFGKAMYSESIANQRDNVQ